MCAIRISLLSIAAVVFLGTAAAHIATNAGHKEANDALFFESGEVGVSQCSMQVRRMLMRQKPQSSCMDGPTFFTFAEINESITS